MPLELEMNAGRIRAGIRNWLMGEPVKQKDDGIGRRGLMAEKTEERVEG